MQTLKEGLISLLIAAVAYVLTVLAFCL